MTVIQSIRKLIALGLVLCALILPCSPAWAMGGVQPPVNEPAPEFTLPAQTGEGQVSLSDYRGQWVLVYFYPKDFTPGCTLEAQRFQRDLEKFQSVNTQIVGISADSAEVHAEFCDSEGLTFPLLADEDGSVSQAYGSWLGNMSMRHSFLIDPEGTLRKTFLKVQPVVHSAEVLDTLSELQSV